MSREDSIRVLREHADEIRALGVARLALFGSLARGEERPESDVDVVVDIEAGRKFSLIDLAGLHVLLSDLFGRETDVVIRKNLRPHMREAVEADAVPVF